MYINDINQPGGIGPIREPIPSKPQKIEEKPTREAASSGPIDRAEIDRISREDARILEGAKLLYEALPEVRSDKIKLARQRLAQGFYDRPEVRQEIANRLVADPEAHAVPPLTEEKTSVIKGRLENGYYDQPEVKSQIARNLLDDAQGEE